MSKILGVIPARLHSTRLKEKLLIEVGGKPLLQWTYEGARGSKYLARLVIATDSEKIATSARRFGAEVIITPEHFNSGSERVAYVARMLPEYDIILNIQGDEPLINAHIIDALSETLINPPYPPIATIGAPIKSEYELTSPDTVKIVCRFDGQALYFSRHPIPFGNGKKLKHIGIYGYRRETLLKLTELPQSEPEISEKLEQLRALYYGIAIMVRVLPEASDLIGVDSETDLAILKQILEGEDGKGKG